MHLDDPIHQNRPHLFVDVSLVAHVARPGEVLALDLEQVLSNLLSVLGDRVYILDGVFIVGACLLLTDLGGLDLPEILDSLLSIQQVQVNLRKALELTGVGLRSR